MTSETPDTTPAAASNGNLVWPPFGHLSFLTFISITSIVVAVGLGLWSLNEQLGYGPDLALIVTLNAFSDALLLLGVIGGVGAIVLAGVRYLLSNPKAAEKVRRTIG